MYTKTKIGKVINSKEKLIKVINDILKTALFLYENGRPDWFISQYINSKLDFLNNFIELKYPYNSILKDKNLIYTGKSTMFFNIDFFDIFVTDFYKNNIDETLIEHSPLKPYTRAFVN